MVERQFTYIKNLFRQNNKDEKELTKYIFEKNDALVLWVIGLSFAFIAGIISNIEKVKLLIDIYNLKITIVLLLVSIIAGILWRLLYLYYFTYLDKTFRQIDVALSDSKTLDTDFHLKGDETFEYLITLNSDFQDLTEVKRVYQLLDVEHKEKFRKEQIDFFRQNTEWAKRDRDTAFEFVKNVYKDTFGITNNLTFEQSIPKLKVVHYSFGIFILYFTTITTFIYALILFAFRIVTKI